MLSLPHDGRYPIVEQTPQQRRQKTLEALTRQLEALSQSKPVLMIFEDVHWVDPTSLEALGRAVDRLRMLSILLIITYRPEIEPLPQRAPPSRLLLPPHDRQLPFRQACMRRSWHDWIGLVPQRKSPKLERLLDGSSVTLC
jgi:predicted ATPase